MTDTLHHINALGEPVSIRTSQLTVSATDIRTNSDRLPDWAKTADFDPDAIVCDVRARLELGDKIFYAREPREDAWRLVVL